MSSKAFDLFCHCSECGAVIQYPDSWDSDYGIFCQDCADNEAQAIVGDYVTDTEDSDLC